MELTFSNKDKSSNLHLNVNTVTDGEGMIVYQTRYNDGSQALPKWFYDNGLFFNNEQKVQTNLAALKALAVSAALDLFGAINSSLQASAVVLASSTSTKSFASTVAITSGGGLTITGGNGTKTSVVKSGTLPAGLTWDGVNNAFAGTPTTPASAVNIVITITDQLGQAIDKTVAVTIT